MLIRLHATLAAVCPIVGVSGEQGSIRVDYAPTATSEQQAAAQAALAAFDWSQAAHDAWVLGLNPERRDLRADAQQAIADNATFLALASPTNAQTLAQVRALTRQMNRVIRRLVQVD
jgi:hypothetical protein